MVKSKQQTHFCNLDLSIEKLNNINNDDDDDDDIDDSIDQFLDQDCIDNCQENNDNNELIIGRRIVIDE